MAIVSVPDSYEGLEEFVCDKCGEMFNDIPASNGHKCKSKDNQGDPGIMNKQAGEIEALLESISESEDALEELIEQYAQAKAKISEYLAEHFDEAQAQTKKSAGIDVFMLWAANKAGLSAEYKTYIELSKKAQIHSSILKSKGDRLFGLHARNKVQDWRQR